MSSTSTPTSATSAGSSARTSASTRTRASSSANSSSAPTRFVAPPTAEITVAPPLRQEVTPFIELTGNTEPFNNVDLVARVEGFLTAINYKDADWRDQLRRACPRGIDIDFENVGGEIMNSVMAEMNLHGRVVLCGLISGYNEGQRMMGPFDTILMKRLTVQGFIILDYAPRYLEAVMQLGQLCAVRAGDRERALDLPQLAVAVLRVVERGRGDRGRLLRHVREHPARRHRHRSGVGGEITANRREQARFPRAVRTDDAHLVPVVHAKRRVVEQRFRSPRQDEVRNAQHQGRSTKS